MGTKLKKKVSAKSAPGQRAAKHAAAAASHPQRSGLPPSLLLRAARTPRAWLRSVLVASLVGFVLALLLVLPGARLAAKTARGGGSGAQHRAETRERSLGAEGSLPRSSEPEEAAGEEVGNVTGIDNSRSRAREKRSRGTVEHSAGTEIEAEPSTTEQTDEARSRGTVSSTPRKQRRRSRGTAEPRPEAKSRKSLKGHRAQQSTEEDAEPEPVGINESERSEVTDLKHVTAELALPAAGEGEDVGSAGATGEGTPSSSASEESANSDKSVLAKSAESSIPGSRSSKFKYFAEIVGSNRDSPSSEAEPLSLKSKSLNLDSDMGTAGATGEGTPSLSASEESTDSDKSVLGSNAESSIPGTKVKGSRSSDFKYLTEVVGRNKDSTSSGAKSLSLKGKSLSLDTESSSPDIDSADAATSADASKSEESSWEAQVQNSKISSPKEVSSDAPSTSLAVEFPFSSNSSESGGTKLSRGSSSIFGSAQINPIHRQELQCSEETIRDIEWSHMRWIPFFAPYRVQGLPIDALDPELNFRRGYSLRFTDDIEHMLHLLPFMRAVQDMSLANRQRRVLIDLGAKNFKSSVLKFLRLYPLNFTEVHVFEVTRGRFTIPEHQTEDACRAMNSASQLRSSRELKVPQSMLQRIHLHNSLVGLEDKRGTRSSPAVTNISRFLKEELKLTQMDAVVVKMDIDGSEWSVLPAWMKDPEMPHLIDDLYVEVHYNHSSMWKFKWYTHPKTREDALNLLVDLREKGFYAHSWP